eukprot:9153638-Pyramimonas_sp.AAC.1
MAAAAAPSLLERACLRGAYSEYSQVMLQSTKTGQPVLGSVVATSNLAASSKPVRWLTRSHAGTSCSVVAAKP